MKHHKVKHNRRRYTCQSETLGVQPNYQYSLKLPELIPTCSQGKNWGYRTDKRRKESKLRLSSYLSFPVDHISDVIKWNIQPPEFFDLESRSFIAGKGPNPWPVGGLGWCQPKKGSSRKELMPSEKMRTICSKHPHQKHGTPSEVISLVWFGPWVAWLMYRRLDKCGNGIHSIDYTGVFPYVYSQPLKTCSDNCLSILVQLTLEQQEWEGGVLGAPTLQIAQNPGIIYSQPSIYLVPPRLPFCISRFNTPGIV